MSNPSTRQQCIDLIDQAGKRQEFITGWGRTPEEYFDEYSYKEPEIWVNILDDLGINKADA